MEEEKQDLKKQIDEQITCIANDGITSSNIDMLGKLVDIHKDLANEEYWNKKKEVMQMRYNYGEYSEGGNYGRGGYGEYGEGSYGRRGVKGTGRGRYRGGRGSGRYRGQEMMDEMQYHYGNYSESGQYGAEGESMEALSNLMESAYEYFKELKENANSPDEMKMMEHYFKKMGQM